MTSKTNYENTYRNAVLTIAVDGASSVKDGFLTSRSISAPKSVTIAYNNKNKKKKRGISGRFTLRHTLAERRKLSALERRGWTLQEDILSPRTLHFGKQQIFWGCQTTHFAEGNPNDESPTGLKGEVRSLGAENNLKAFILDRFEDPVYISGVLLIPRREYVLWRWYQTIADYGARIFSHDEDVFPGIAAIVDEVADQLGLTYKVGIWQEDIHRGLLWRVSEPSELSEGYRAPLWTWACVALAATELRFNLVYYDLLKGYSLFHSISPRRRTGDAEVMDVHY
jgi:hypothetical protein